MASFAWFSFKKHRSVDFPKCVKIEYVREEKQGKFIDLIDDLYPSIDVWDDLLENCIAKIDFVNTMVIQDKTFPCTFYTGVKMYKNCIKLPKGLTKRIISRVIRIVVKDLKELYDFSECVNSYVKEQSRNNPYEDMEADYDEETDTVWYPPHWYTFSRKSQTFNVWFEHYGSDYLVIERYE